MEKSRTFGKIIEEEDIEEDKEEDQKIIITMRCVDMASPTSDVDIVPCSECGETTWLSAGSRNVKFDKIICEQCFFKSGKHKEEDYCACVTEKCLNDALAALYSLGINITKEEMIRRMEEKIGKKLEIINREKDEKQIEKKNKRYMK